MNRMGSRALFTLVLLVSAATAAAEYSDLYVVPVAGHVRGAFGSSWRSDVVLHNIQAVPISVEMALVESGLAPSAAPLAVTAGGESTFLLMPGETRTFEDVAGNLGRDATGALIVGADLPFALTSRTWAELPARRTLGQSVVPVAIGGAADAINDAAVLPSLATQAGLRSNAGVFIAASDAPLIVEVVWRSEDGASAGSQLIVADEPGLMHRQLPIARPAATGPVTAVVRILEGDGIVVPYASTIENTSAEAFFVTGSPVAARAASSREMLVRAVRRLPAGDQ